MECTITAERLGKAMSFFPVSAAERNFLFRFFACFSALFAALHALDAFIPSMTFPIKYSVATSAAAVLGLFGYPVSVSGLLLGSPLMSFRIVIDCTGLVLLILLYSLMFAFRLSAKKSLAYFAFYAPFLLAFNVLRVAFTIAVGISYGEAAMDAVHMALWVFDSLLVLCLWTRAAGISFGAKKVAFAS